MRTIFTIGHSTRSFDEFAALLRSAGVDLVLDVRRFPGSRRQPQFNRENLSGALRSLGIGYAHLPDLGGRRTSERSTHNLFWRNKSFRAYADYMGSDGFQTALGQVLVAAETRTPALMCAEAMPWRCHRQLIADALVARGARVRHLLGEGRVDAHALNAAAVISPSGAVHYPGKASDQGTLFGA